MVIANRCEKLKHRVSFCRRSVCKPPGSSYPLAYLKNIYLYHDDEPLSRQVIIYTRLGRKSRTHGNGNMARVRNPSKEDAPLISKVPIR